jgi:hypothetical protein
VSLLIPGHCILLSTVNFLCSTNIQRLAPCSPHACHPLLWYSKTKNNLYVIYYYIYIFIYYRIFLYIILQRIAETLTHLTIYKYTGISKKY